MDPPVFDQYLGMEEAGEGRIGRVAWRLQRLVK
jgi:hypothetical protein